MNKIEIIPVKVFVCPSCGEHYESEADAQACYEECLENIKEDEAAKRKFEKEQKAKLTKAVRKYVQMVKGKKGGAIKCLIKNGFEDEAWIMCLDLLSFDYDFENTDRDIVINKMLEEAKK